MRVAVVGITGMVGRLMLEVLKERSFPITEFFAVASEKSAGKQITFKNKLHTILQLEDLLKKDLDLAFFSAGSDVSKEWAPKLAKKYI